MLIEQPPLWYRKLFPGALFRMEDKDKKPGKLYLTFDDGPIPEVTPWVLDVLDKWDIKATFFVVGQNVERYPELLREIKLNGHKVGNHTFHHLKGITTKRNVYLKDVEKCEKLTGAGLFRPPHGFVSYGKLKALSERYQIVMYDVITRDYSRKLSWEEIVANVKRYTRNGSIIVFHDSLKSFPRLKKSLPLCLEWLKEKGFEFSTIPEKG